MQPVNEKKVYFPSLNGLRFIAASLVIIYHIEQLKSLFGLKNYWRANAFIEQIGGLGVTLFFVLSGFLITYLLLAERDNFQKIHLINFYIRRVLRIWPLYYFLIITGFFIVPFFLSIPNTESAMINGSNKLFLFFIFLPNVSIVILPMVPFVAHLWSVGVEEQFYLVWPLLLRISKNKTIFFLIAIVILMSALRIIILHYYSSYISGQYFLRFLNYTRIDCMAIGGIGSCILNNNRLSILNVIFKVSFQVMVYSILMVALLFGVGWLNHFYLNDVFYSIIFIVVLLNLASNKKSIFNLENKVLNWLGKISYGLYMYHVIAIVFSIKIVQSIFDNDKSFVFHGVIFILSFLFTIFLSAISYEFFERKFLLLKNKFSFIKSG